MIPVDNTESWKSETTFGLLPSLMTQEAEPFALIAAQTCNRAHPCFELPLNLESFYIFWQMDHNHVSKYVVYVASNFQRGSLNALDFS